MKSYDYRFRVPLHHVDHAGVLFFANLFLHAHDAWEAFMHSLDADLSELIEAGQWRIPIVHTEADYKLPMRHGEELEIRLQIEHLGRSSMRVVYLFIDRDDEQLAIARTTHVFVDAVTNHSAAIPAELRIRLQEYAAS